MENLRRHVLIYFCLRRSNILHSLKFVPVDLLMLITGFKISIEIMCMPCYYAESSKMAPVELIYIYICASVLLTNLFGWNSLMYLLCFIVNFFRLFCTIWNCDNSYWHLPHYKPEASSISDCCSSAIFFQVFFISNWICNSFPSVSGYFCSWRWLHCCRHAAYRQIKTTWIS